jgi:hypothetical protein
MNEQSRRWLLWAPRILAILVCLFLGVFALDASGLSDFALHVAPTLLLLAVVAVSWRWEWVGGVVFTGLGIAYAYVSRGHASWVLCISLPLLAVGVWYGWNWRHHRELHAHV